MIGFLQHRSKTARTGMLRIYMGVSTSSRAFAAAMAALVVSLLLSITGAAEAAVPAATLAGLEQQVAELEAEYAARHAALQHEMQGRLAALEAQIAALTSGADAPIPSQDRKLSSPGRATSRDDPALEVGGDFRLRYEHTSAHADDPARDRGVLRGRLGASYAVNERFTVGGRITTGDPDDPNSADVTMDEFVDDLTVSLDQAYARYRLEDLEIVGGKFANPFASTELVWDGDVNPYGLAARHRLYRGAGLDVSMTGIYSVVDEQIAARGSDMLGAQVSLAFEPAADWQFGFDAAYYDYEVGSLVAADSGDTRENNLTPDGSAYLSDFDLLDLIATLDYAGLPGGWPLRIVGDHVRNLGAAVPEDSGWSLDFSLGELSEVGDWRFGCGYAVAETDAVLAAFSQDNTTYATNYREHTVTVDYLAFEDTFLNLTGYLYRRDDYLLANPLGDNDWISRVRLNLQFSF
jgi:hypothetical protein